MRRSYSALRRSAASIRVARNAGERQARIATMLRTVYQTLNQRALSMDCTRRTCDSRLLAAGAASRYRGVAARREMAGRAHWDPAPPVMNGRSPIHCRLS